MQGRPEIELVDIPQEVYDEISEAKLGEVTKYRHMVPLRTMPGTKDPVFLEVDQYIKFPGKWVAEFEIPKGVRLARDEDGKPVFSGEHGRVYEQEGIVFVELPEWLKDSIDVTDDQRFKNGELARTPEDKFPEVGPEAAPVFSPLG